MDQIEIKNLKVEGFKVVTFSRGQFLFRGLAYNSPQIKYLYINRKIPCRGEYIDKVFEKCSGETSYILLFSYFFNLEVFLDFL